MGGSEARFLQELVLYAASAALSSLVLFVGLRSLDPNRAANKKAAEQKREIARRLGRPLIQTNAYEVRGRDGPFGFFIGFFQIFLVLLSFILVSCVTV